MWNANPLQTEGLSFIHCGSSTQRGQFTFLLTPNPRCGDVECQPPEGLEIVVYTLWIEYTSGQFTFFLTPKTPAAVIWKANPLEAERLSFIHYGSSTQMGHCHFSPNA